MKKIYMIMAAIALLSMSLNAQNDVKKVEEATPVSKITAMASNVKAKPYTGKNVAPTMNELLNGIKGMKGILPTRNPNVTPSAKGQSRAPMKINAGETTVGPFEGDNFSTNGIGYPTAYGNNGQGIYIFADLDRSQFVDHDGDEIVGFRFALAGSTSQTAVLYDFMAWPYGTNGYFESANRHTWQISEYDDNAIMLPTYDDIVITVNSGTTVNFSSIYVYDQDNNVLSYWTSNGSTSTVTSGGTTYTYYVMPEGWTLSNVYMFRYSTGSSYIGYLSTTSEGSITIDKSILEGSTSVRVVISAYSDNGTETLDVNGDTRTLTTSSVSYTFNQTSTGSAPASYIELAAGQWHEYYLDEPIPFTVADSIAGMYLGYNYYQFPSTSSYLQYPIAVNPQSTGTDHVSYRYGPSSTSYSDITITPRGTSVNFTRIALLSGSTTIKEWVYNSSNYALPSTWTCSGSWSSYQSSLCYTNGTITIPASDFSSYSDVKVAITAYGDNSSQYITVAGEQKSITTSSATYTWDITPTVTYTSGWWTEDYSQYGDLAVQLIFKSSKTAAPVITGQVDPNNENNYVITATGDGTVTLTVGGQTVTGTGSASITVPRTDVDQNVTATATAQDGDKEESDPTTENFVVPKLVTEAPVITSVTNETSVVITATGNGTVTLVVDGQTYTGQGTVSVTITRTNVDQTVTATATAQETGKAVSETTTENITVPALPITPTPTITYVVNGDNVVITATGEGTVNLSTSDGQTATGNGSASITVPRTDETYTVTATATAQATNHQQSATATEPITVPFLQTDMPDITVTTDADGETVTITATGDGTVTLTVDGRTEAGEGSVSITLPYGVVATTVTATATAQETGKAQSETATQQVTIPAGEGWTEMLGEYNNDNDLLSFLVEVDGDTLDIMMVDQFLASTKYNAHPAGYDYVMKETINGVEKSSNVVNIPVYKTNSTMQGFYTKGQVDTADIHMELKAQVINSEMNYDVAPDHNTLYYSLYRGDLNADYPLIDVASRKSQLQRYEEKDANDNVYYFLNENHHTGVVPYYDQIGSMTVERLDTNYVQGVYNDEISYVPVIWTLGINSGRDKSDGLNNSYGSDIKREKLGDVNIISIGGSMSGGNNAENTGNGWEGYYTYEGVQYCIYTPIITVEGITPEKYIQNDGDTSKYVPYMYRVWCLYDGARNFNNNAQGILVDAGAKTAPFLLGEEVITDPNVNRVTIGKAWQSGQGPLQWAFAVPRSTSSADVQFAVRFYYKKVVTEAQTANSLKANRDADEQEEYYIVEETGNGSSIPVSINEFLSGRTITSVTYVNAQGMKSDKPFDGMNIVVTRYSDGTTSTTKVIR